MMTLILHSGYLLELVPGNFHMFVNFNLHSGCLLYCCIDDKKEPKKRKIGQELRVVAMCGREHPLIPT